MSVESISPFLWFDDRAEEAARFYVSVFARSRIRRVVRYGPEGPGRPGSVMVVDFELAGKPFTALNGGPVFRFTPAVSLYIRCRTQSEVDRLWDRLSRNGKPGQCGWLEDRFGLSWQVVPDRLVGLLSDSDPDRVARVTRALLRMRKIDIGTLDAAARSSATSRSGARRTRKGTG